LDGLLTGTTASTVGKKKEGMSGKTKDQSSKRAGIRGSNVDVDAP